MEVQYEERFAFQRSY